MRDHLPSLIPSLLRSLSKAFETVLPAEQCTKDWTKISPHSACQYIAETLNSVVFVGEDTGRLHSNDITFLKPAMQYTRDVVITGEVLRFCPPFLQIRPVGWLTMNWRGAKNKVYKRLLHLFYERMRDQTSLTQQPCDFVQWILNATRRKTPSAIVRLSQHIMGLMFGGAHQMPMYPEYLEPLVEEIKTTQQRHPEGTRQYDELHLMDSFLKETARLNPTVVCMSW
ncbi:MAG: hypothetical protein LQ352_006558 [Teloschistes flavicans]|nr:MAG: hypothetical protein LQ352_006558 [Teloschistes flavicans]